MALMEGKNAGLYYSQGEVGESGIDDVSLSISTSDTDMEEWGILGQWSNSD